MDAASTQVQIMARFTSAQHKLAWQFTQAPLDQVFGET
jgi:hypothetical protein